MKIHYSQILKKNMLNVFRDVLKGIEENGLQEGHHLYIVFQTDVKKVVIPGWLKEKHPKKPCQKNSYILVIPCVLGVGGSPPRSAKSIKSIAIRRH